MRKIALLTLLALTTGAWASIPPRTDLTVRTDIKPKKEGLDAFEQTSQDIGVRFITDKAGTAKDITGASQVLFYYEDTAESFGVTVTGSVESATNGQVLVSLLPANLATNSGTGSFKWFLTVGDGTNTLGYAFGPLDVKENILADPAVALSTGTNVNWATYSNFLNGALGPVLVEGSGLSVRYNARGQAVVSNTTGGAAGDITSVTSAAPAYVQIIGGDSGDVGVNVTNVATAAQGATADTALQPADTNGWNTATESDPVWTSALAAGFTVGGAVEVEGDLTASNSNKKIILTPASHLIYFTDGAGAVSGYLSWDTGGVFKTIWDYEIWDSGHDGSGSGLDADLLDGENSSDFHDASQLTGIFGPMQIVTDNTDGISLTNSTFGELSGRIVPELGGKLLITGGDSGGSGYVGITGTFGSNDVVTIYDGYVNIHQNVNGKGNTWSNYVIGADVNLPAAQLTGNTPAAALTNAMSGMAGDNLTWDGSQFDAAAGSGSAVDSRAVTNTINYDGNAASNVAKIVMQNGAEIQFADFVTALAFDDTDNTIDVNGNMDGGGTYKATNFVGGATSASNGTLVTGAQMMDTAAAEGWGNASGAASFVGLIAYNASTDANVATATPIYPYSTVYTNTTGGGYNTSTCTYTNETDGIYTVNLTVDWTEIDDGKRVFLLGYVDTIFYNRSYYSSAANLTISHATWKWTGRLTNGAIVQAYSQHDNGDSTPDCSGDDPHARTVLIIEQKEAF